MPIPQTYVTSPEAAVNFDFADVLTDVGYVTLTALDDEAGGQKLSRLVVDSTNLRTSVAQPGSVESNFDFEFLTSQKVKGDLLLTITIWAHDTGTGNTTNDTTVEIFHVDSGATETTIGTQQAITQLVTAGDGNYRTTLTFAVDKQFAVGDKLRVEVISTITGNAGGDVGGVYHDPLNRTTITDQHSSGANTNLIVQVPFQLDL